MFRFLKNLFSAPATPKKNNSAFLRSVHYHMVDRRQYQRVVYPAVGALGSLPAVECDGHFLEPINISVGGVMLLNPALKNAKTGQQFNFRLFWSSKHPEITQKAELVRVYKNHWHFRFVEIDRRYLAEFPRIFKSAIRGATTVEFKQNQIPPGEHIVELWMSEQGDYVIFQKPPADKSETIIIHLDGTRYRFIPDEGLFLGAKNAGGVLIYETPVGFEVIDEVLIFLANFRNASPRIRRTISELIHLYYRAKLEGERRRPA